MSWLKILLSQFSSPLIYLLVAASAVTAIIGDRLDAAVIAAAVGLNTVLGFFQEYKAEKSLAALKKFLTPKAKVVRQGKRQMINAGEVVVGDICVLEMGERVPADGVLTEAEQIILNEAVLTGESLPVAKKTGDKVFMGTFVAGGIGQMKVITIGQKTRFGLIAASLKETKEPLTPLQKKLAGLSQKLTVFLGGICGLIFIFGLARGDDLVGIFTTSVAVAVGAIPEGLVIALTVVLAIGMQRILKRKALVRQLLAAETLGSVTVICCDKTGTLTEGKMEVVGALTDDEPLLRRAAVQCNDQRDPLELAMLEWGREKFRGTGQRLGSIPFDHDRKYIVTRHPGMMFVSGAPEVILKLSQVSAEKSRQILKTFKSEAAKGYRLVGFAYKKFQGKTGPFKLSEAKDLRWLGILLYADPIRPGVKEVLAKARREGIKVKLITGDHPATALAVGRQLGFDRQDIYGRVAPEEKLKIVAGLQRRGEVVAMMGDGVNDAPALKKADIGIVVADASAVAIQTADMVLLDNNFATILAAVEEGRLIFANIAKVLYYLMANAFAEIVLVIGSMAANLPLPLTAAQILWINLVNDSWPAFALAVDSGRGRVKPELFPRKTQINMTVISLLTGLSGLYLFYRFGSQTLVFTLIAVTPLIYSLVIGSLKNLWLWLAIIVGFGFQALVLYWRPLAAVFQTTALGVEAWLIVIGLGLLITVIMKMVGRYDFN